MTFQTHTGGGRCPNRGVSPHSRQAQEKSSCVNVEGLALYSVVVVKSWDLFKNVLGKLTESQPIILLWHQVTLSVWFNGLSHNASQNTTMQLSFTVSTLVSPLSVIKRCLTRVMFFMFNKGGIFPQVCIPLPVVLAENKSNIRKI